MAGKMILETERLMLREMTKEDIPKLYEFLGDPDVMYAYEHGFTMEEVKAWYDRQQKRYEEYGFGLWAVIRKSDGMLIGDCGITMQDIGKGEGEKKEEIGYHFRKDCWHKGYATEAAKAVKQYAFHTLPIAEIYSVIRDTNNASRRTAERNGMKKCGTTVRHYMEMDMLHEVYSVRKIPYETVFFDLDGTLIDSERGILHSVDYALQKFGKTMSKEEMLPFIGPPLIFSFQEYAGLSREDAERAVAYYRENFGPKGVYEYQMYAGIPSMLKRLKKAGKRIVMATSKPEVYAEIIAEHAGIRNCFDMVCGSGLDGSRLTKEDVIVYALETCGLEQKKESVLMVGDRKHDILGAKAFGLSSAGVLYGFGTQTELREAGADYIFSTVKELEHYLISEAESGSE